MESGCQVLAYSIVWGDNPSGDDPISAIFVSFCGSIPVLSCHLEVTDLPVDQFWVRHVLVSGDGVLDFLKALLRDSSDLLHVKPTVYIIGGDECPIMDFVRPGLTIMSLAVMPTVEEMRHLIVEANVSFLRRERVQTGTRH